MKNEFCCFSFKLMKFLTGKGFTIKNIKKHAVSGDIFYIFDKTEAFCTALTEWHDTKPTYEFKGDNKNERTSPNTKKC